MIPQALKRRLRVREELRSPVTVLPGLALFPPPSSLLAYYLAMVGNLGAKSSAFMWWVRVIKGFGLWFWLPDVV